MTFILADPWFVVPWFAVGIAAAAWILYDAYRVNTPLNSPLKPGFVIITLFFSVFGLLLYLSTARPPRQEGRSSAEKRGAFQGWVQPGWKKAVGASIHCVAGDGLGIFTAMVLSRIWNLAFWPEFWFEYLVGFAFGWFIFQYWAMREHMPDRTQAFWHAGRAEFFSMVTVMAGMGVVMGVVTPMILGHSPDPWTAAFWGFGAFGLLVGFIFTLPMNWWLIKRGYKEGMG